MTTEEITNNLKPVEIDPQIVCIVKRLERLIPLFSAHKPEGWKDFTDGDLNFEWRSGIFVKAQVPLGTLELKAKFGTEAAARLAASQFAVATGMSPSFHEGRRLPFNPWGVSIFMPLSDVNW